MAIFVLVNAHCSSSEFVNENAAKSLFTKFRMHNHEFGIDGIDNSISDVQTNWRSEYDSN